MKPITQLLLVGIFGLVLASRVSAQYLDEDGNYVGGEEDDGDRDARQIAPYAAVPPTRSCARVWYGSNYCGGFSSGTGGGCDEYCNKQGYEYSWCRPTYCLCHRGEDRGRECDVLT